MEEREEREAGGRGRRRLGVAVLKAAAALCAVALAGCSLFRDKSPVTVGDSQLNWLNVRYHPANGTAPCYINIVGVGSVEFRQGRSPLVFDSFSQDYDNPLWGDIAEEKLGVTPAQARWMMQLFMDAGLATEHKRMKSLSAKERSDASAGIATISAKLDGKVYRVRTNNPDLTGVIDAIVESIVSNRGFR
ncbi:MAG: hypothetical protein IJP66_08930 [Kiritimatiellae bacterium]|nr:hypothetical protein [Kiritimatiellia bacterium]